MLSSFFKRSVIVFLVLYFVVTITWILSSNSIENFNVIRSMPKSRGVSAVSLIDGLTAQNFMEAFPYEKYNGTNLFKDILDVKRDITTIDSLFPGVELAGQQLMAEALTNKLMPSVQNIFKEYNPDSLLFVLEWAESLKYYAVLDSKNSIFYEAVSDFWLGEISKGLTAFQHEKKSLKNDFRFQFLAQRCAFQKYPVNIKGSKIEKFKNSLLSGNWAHLIKATWNDLSLFFKWLVLFAFIGTFISFFFFLRRVYNKFKK